MAGTLRRAALRLTLPSLIKVFFLAPFSPLVFAAPLDNTVLSTQKPAAQLIEHLSPLLSPPASITAMDHQLIIRATPSAVNEIKRVLNIIDTPPENLIIEIRQQPVTQSTSLTTTNQRNKVISTRTLKAPLITTYKLIEGEELTLKRSQSPEFLLHWPIQQHSVNDAFTLTLTVQRIGERIQLQYRLEENRTASLKQSAAIKGVLLGHMNNWINLTPSPQVPSNHAHYGTNKRIKRTLNPTIDRPPIWQIKVRKEE